MKNDVNRELVSSVMVLLLFILLILIEPPVTLLAWIITLAITGSLVFIVSSMFNIRKKASQQ
ncbi:MAG: hypothetical protein HYY49_05720 [Ignavibacteriales bacterium]|nr:hypothetical protein [Ignavibacteriales bacterium]